MPSPSPKSNPGITYQMTEIRRQRSEVRGQRSEVRDQKSVFCFLSSPPARTWRAGPPAPAASLCEAKRRGWAVVFCLLILSGCGYKPLPALREDIKKIYVPTFQNYTYESGISAILTDALREEILLDGTFRLVPSEEAHAVLNGSVISYEHSPTVYDADENMVGGTAKLTVQVTFKYVGGEVIWKEELGDQESTSYFLTGNLSTREVDLKKFVAEKVARKIVVLITEKW